MKKKILCGALLCIACGLAGFGCKDPNPSTSSSGDSSSVEGAYTPDSGLLDSIVEDKTELFFNVDLRIEEGNLVWKNIANATSYEFSVGGESKTFSASDTLVFAVPQKAGKYTAKVVVVGTGFVNGYEEEFAFTVVNATPPTAELSANGVSFGKEGDKIYYRLSETEEWTEVNEGRYLDFSSSAAGKAISLQYYGAQSGFDGETNTYYIDSAVQTLSFTVKGKLGSPTLSASADGTLSWEGVTGANQYLVEADGVSKEVSTTSVALEKSLGGHVVSVQALPADSNTYTAGEKSYFTYEVREQRVNVFTVWEDSVLFDKSYVDKGILKQKKGNDWTTATSNGLDKVDLCVKLGAWFDEAQSVWFTESKPLRFTTDAAPSVTFDKTGALGWNLSDGGYFLYQVYPSQDEKPSDYVVTGLQGLDLTDYEAGEYTFVGKTEAYIEQGGTENVYHEGRESQSSFYVLPSPEVETVNGRLSWNMDSHAAEYLFGQDKEALTANEKGYVDVTGGLKRYYLQAIGSEETGNWTVDSPVVEVYADSTLTSGALSAGLGNFNGDEYLNRLSQPFHGSSSTTSTYSILKNSTVYEEQVILDGAVGGDAVKVVAGNAAPKNSNCSGNGDGIAYQLLSPLSLTKATAITFRIYVDVDYTDAATDAKQIPMIFALDGTSKQLATSATNYGNSAWTKIPVKQWFEYTVSLNSTVWQGGEDAWGKTFDGLKDIRYAGIGFADCGKEGYTFYLDEIRYTPIVETEPLTEEELLAGFAFDSELKLYTKIDNFSFTAGNTTVADGKISPITSTTAEFDEASSSVRFLGMNNVQYRRILLDDVTLKKGDILEIVYKNNCKDKDGNYCGGGLSFDIDGKITWKKNFEAGDGSDTFKTLSVSVNEDITLSELYIVLYSGSNSTSEFYLKSVQIKRVKTALTAADLESGVTFDGAESMNYIGFYNGSEQIYPATSNYIEYDSEKQAIHYKGGWNTTALVLRTEEIVFQAGDTLTITYTNDTFEWDKNASATSYSTGGLLKGDATYLAKLEKQTGEEFVTLTYTFTETTAGTVENLMMKIYWGNNKNGDDASSAALDFYLRSVQLTRKEA